MVAPLIIIGSGFAAYQLVKTVRRQNSEMAIQVFSAGCGGEYNKPDLSHVFTRQQRAADLISMTGEAFAQKYEIELYAHTSVQEINAEAHYIIANGKRYPYYKLVLATGAKTFIPEIKGDAAGDLITLNSLQEYSDAELRISNSTHILLMGGGLIGVELAMDLTRSGKQVRIVEPSAHLLANLMPDFVATALERQLRSEAIRIESLSYVTAINQGAEGLCVTTSNGAHYQADCVISAAGLVPNIVLAKQAGIEVNRGIVVDKQLRTSHEDIYALGDCAEINGKVLAFLQPIVLSANTLASQLLCNSAELTLPAMMVKVKTPGYPIQLGGQYDLSSNWQVSFSEQGIIAKAYDQSQQLTGFVLTRDKVNLAFPLLREVQCII